MKSPLSLSQLRETIYTSLNRFCIETNSNRDAQFCTCIFARDLSPYVDANFATLEIHPKAARKIPPGFAGKIVKVRPLPEPVRLQDLKNLARS